MSLEKLLSAASRLFFLGAFALFGLAVVERIANATAQHLPRAEAHTGVRGRPAIFVIARRGQVDASSAAPLREASLKTVVTRRTGMPRARSSRRRRCQPR
jgi:hypothetical protein